MEKHLNLAALLLVLFFAGCKKDVQREETTEGSATQQKAATGGTTTTNRAIYLEVTVESFDGTMITADNGGKYIHGTDRVQAVIWGDSGDFFWNTNTNAARSPLRKIVFDPSLPSRLNEVISYRMRTQNVGGSSASMLHQMGVGEKKYLGFFIWGEKSAGVFDWKLRFQYYLDPSPLTDKLATTDYVLVERLSGPPNKSVWTLESVQKREPLYEGEVVANEDPVIPYNAYLQDVANPTASIYLRVPFKLRLTER
jgi:hypothetical protein